MDKIIKRCRDCLYRHSCIHEFPPLGTDCEYWRIGKCYTCKYKDAPDDEWFKRGCETWCCSGCDKYKRDWKKTWEWFKQKIFAEEGQG